MERLDPSVRVVWLVRVFILAVIVGVGVGFAVGALDGGPIDSPVVAGGAAFAFVALVGVVHTELRYRAWGFEVQDDTLYIERGVLVNVRTVVPYVRVQHVDSRKGPLERVLGLGRVVVYTAGSRGADVSIPGLRAERATEVQQSLRQLAIESEPESEEAGDAV
jgi:membrane protein YdbS with pleckstrin-like domain